MTKAVLSGYFGFNNFGDEAILSVLINRLKLLNIDITVFSGNPKFSEKLYGVRAVKSFNFFKVIPALFKTDILFSGGGSLLQDVTSTKSLLYYCFIIFSALIFRKKVIIFAQGIGPLTHKYTRFIVKFLLKRCNYVSVRDDNSANLLKSWGINCETVCDPIYSIHVNRSENKGTVGIQLRSYPTINYNLLTKLAEQIVIDFNDKKIELFSFQNSVDLNLLKKFEGILKALKPDIDTEIIPAKSLKETLNRVTSCEYLIAMRFHAVLAGLMAGIKTCAINYDIKVEKLADDAKIPLISMIGENDFTEIFEEMKNLSSENLLKFVQTKKFDWTNIEKVINS